MEWWIRWRNGAPIMPLGRRQDAACEFFRAPLNARRQAAAHGTAPHLDAEPVQLTRADVIAAALELAGERAQELIALLDRNRGSHYGLELFVGEADHSPSSRIAVVSLSSTVTARILLRGRLGSTRPEITNRWPSYEVGFRSFPRLQPGEPKSASDGLAQISFRLGIPNFTYHARAKAQRYFVLSSAQAGGCAERLSLIFLAAKRSKESSSSPPSSSLSSRRKARAMRRRYRRSSITGCASQAQRMPAAEMSLATRGVSRRRAI